MSELNKGTLTKFIHQLQALPRVVIQAHDFPDHDAVSAAFGFAYLLKQYDISTLIVYNGNIDRISLSNMIDWLNIPIFHCSKAQLSPADKIITIDGCIGEKNVTDMPGLEIAVIDHHNVVPPSNLWFCDVRPNYGATATIIYEYFQLLELDMPANIASALLVGLNIDTANLTRGFCQNDIQAFIAFNQLADLDLVNRVCRNSLIHSELKNFQTICNDVEVNNGVAHVYIQQPCAKNLLGVLADFLLSVNEFDIVIVAMSYNHNIHLSLRSECPKVHVGELLRKTLNQRSLGFGGGHGHMAGGFIPQQEIHHFVDHEHAHFSPLIDVISHLRSH